MASKEFNTGLDTVGVAKLTFDRKKRTFSVNILRGYRFRLDPVTFGYRIVFVPHGENEMIIGDVKEEGVDNYIAEAGHFTKRESVNPYEAAAITLCNVMYHHH